MAHGDRRRAGEASRRQCGDCPIVLGFAALASGHCGVAANISDSCVPQEVHGSALAVCRRQIRPLMRTDPPPRSRRHHARSQGFDERCLQTGTLDVASSQSRIHHASTSLRLSQNPKASTRAPSRILSRHAMPPASRHHAILATWAVTDNGCNKPWTKRSLHSVCPLVDAGAGGQRYTIGNLSCRGDNRLRGVASPQAPPRRRPCRWVS